MPGETWVVAVDGSQLKGDHDADQVRALVARHPGRQIVVWSESMPEWADPLTLRQFKPLPPQPPPPPPVPAVPLQKSGSSTSPTQPRPARTGVVKRVAAGIWVLAVISWFGYRVFFEGPSKDTTAWKAGMAKLQPMEKKLDELLTKWSAMENDPAVTEEQFADFLNKTIIPHLQTAAPILISATPKDSNLLALHQELVSLYSQREAAFIRLSGCDGEETECGNPFSEALMKFKAAMMQLSVKVKAQ